jgi:hypothetical protein
MRRLSETNGRTTLTTDDPDSHLHGRGYLRGDRASPSQGRNRRDLNPEAGRLATSDESQLEWASANDRSIVTFNVAHFASLHRDWMRSGRSHAGVILSSQQPIGELLRRLGKLLDALDADSMRDRLEFLADWR